LLQEKRQQQDHMRYFPHFVDSIIFTSEKDISKKKMNIELQEEIGEGFREFFQKENYLL
jgi:hypothetical protein